MKNPKLMLLIVALVATVTLVIIGIAFSGSTETPPATEPTVIEPPATEPSKPVVPSGTYYYIMGTATAYTGNEEHMKDLPAYLPHITFNGENYEGVGTFGNFSGTSYLENESIVFCEQDTIQQRLQVSVEHDEMWHAMYYPKQETPWRCVYDAETKIITISHNSDFVQFMYFETVEHYTQYIRDTFMKDGVFEIYPTPHEIEGDIPGIPSTH